MKNARCLTYDKYEIMLEKLNVDVIYILSIILQVSPSFIVWIKNSTFIKGRICTVCFVAYD